MAIQLVNVGTVPNDGTGDPLRTAFQKVNANLGELLIRQGHYANLAAANAALTVPVPSGFTYVATTADGMLLVANQTDTVYTPYGESNLAIGTVTATALPVTNSYGDGFSLPAAVASTAPGANDGTVGTLTAEKAQKFDNGGLIFKEDFTGASYNTSVIKQFFATIAHDTANDRLSLTSSGSTSPGFYLDAAALGLKVGRTYVVRIDWTKNTSHGLLCSSGWSTQSVDAGKTIINDGVHTVLVVRSNATGGSNNSPVFVSRRITTNEAHVCYINSIEVYECPGVNATYPALNASIFWGSDIRVESFGQHDIIIGHQIKIQSGTVSSAIGTVAIGGLITGVATGGTEKCVVIGYEGKLDNAGLAGASNSPGRLALGWKAWSGAWRGVAVGPGSAALHTSSSAFGFGATSEKSHGNAMGRGAFIPEVAPIAPTTVTDGCVVFKECHLYLSNGLFHHCDPSYGSTAVNSTLNEESGVDPATYFSYIHGKNAFDARSSPSDTNVAGGPIGVCGGMGTGTGVGGKIEMLTSPPGASGSAQNALVAALRVDAVATGGSEETRFLLLDLTSGTMKRVGFGTDDGGVVGKKVLVVDA